MVGSVQQGRDILVVTKLDRLARSVPDVRAISDQLEGKGQDAREKAKAL